MATSEWQDWAFHELDSDCGTDKQTDPRKHYGAALLMIADQNRQIADMQNAVQAERDRIIGLIEKMKRQGGWIDDLISDIRRGKVAE